MGWFKKLFGLKEKVPQETIVSDEHPKITQQEEIGQLIEEKETAQNNLPKILIDKDGNDLMCKLCNNEDNETGKYFPIREGDKRSFNGEIWHTKCLRIFKKAGARGELF